nr:AI-2E family transporter [Winogradskyella sp. DF17]
MLGLIAWTFFILKPFILIFIWAIILAVALFPIFESWSSRFRNKKLGVILFTSLIALILFTPAYILIKEISVSGKSIVKQIKSDEHLIPNPSEDVKSWPLIGDKMYNEWSALSSNAKAYALEHKDIFIDKGTGLLSRLTGFFGTLFVFVASFLISVVLMYKAEFGYKTGQLLFGKLFGLQSDEIIHMCRDTIRSVVKGILLVAVIQTVLALIGFKLIGLPAAGFFAFLILVAAIMQIPALLVMIPAILLAFSTSDTTPAIIFTVYAIAVALSDNFLKPILLGKGLQTPMIIILVGTLGGMLLHGIIGLFVGAVVLSVAHRLYMFWVNSDGSTLKK